MQIHAINDQVAWVAVADELNPISGRVYKTTNGGVTWEEQSTGFTGFNETPAAVYFWDENSGVAFGATGFANYNDLLRWKQCVPCKPLLLQGTRHCAPLPS